MLPLREHFYFMSTTTEQPQALIIAYCAIAKHKGRKEFIDKQIKKNIFGDYLKGIEENNNHHTIRNKCLFKPEAYYLWGKYDVCLISEVDDLEFATRFFRPYNPIGESNDEEYTNFDYQLHTGINPVSGKDVEDGQLPYIAVTELKVNSAFLIGNGLIAIESIIKEVEKCICTVRNDEIKVNYRICESYSYHELILTLQSNSIDALKNIVKKIRGTQLKDIENRDQILANSIFHELVNNQNSDKLNADDVGNHIFESTTTRLGVHEYIYDLPVSQWEKQGAWQPKNGENIKFISNWSIKPGHLVNVLKTIHENKPVDMELRTYSTAGCRGDLVIITDIKIDNQQLDRYNPLTFPGLLFKNPAGTQQSCEEIDPLVEAYTTLAFEIDDHTQCAYEKEYEGSHPDLHNQLKKLQISPRIVRQTRARMKKLRMPKVLADKVIKLIANYNNAVKNPEMYAFYAELYNPIIFNVIAQIEDYSEKVFEERPNDEFYTHMLVPIIEKVCENLEYGFENRFYQSYWTSETIDVNLDYSGGLQNLISSYDSCFKSLNNAFINNHPNTSFVAVKSNNKVSATSYSMLLNYLHLIQPYIYCAIAIHETSNFAVRKLQNNIQFKENSIANHSLQSLLYLIRKARITEHIKLPVPENIEWDEDTPVFDDSNSKFSQFKYDLNYGDLKLGYFIGELTFRYFITDYINYHYGYKKQYELFCKTSWSYFLQLGDVYEKYEEIDLGRFITMALRMSLIKKYGGESDKDFFPKVFLENTSFKKLVDECNEHINSFIETIEKSTEVGLDEWFSETAHHLGNVFDGIKKKYELESEQVNIQIREYLYGENPLPLHTIISNIQQYLLSFSNKADSTIDALLPVYRNIIFSTITHYTEGIRILTRTSSEGDPDTFEEERNNKIRILIDPCGGTFLKGETNRYTYMKERIKFIRIMFHLAQLHKKQYISDIFNPTNK